MDHLRIGARSAREPCEGATAGVRQRARTRRFLQRPITLPLPACGAGRKTEARWARSRAFSNTTGRSRSISSPAIAFATSANSRCRSTERPAQAGGALHGLRHPVLPRPDRLPGAQPDPGLERPRLQRRLGGGRAQPAFDQQLPGIHRPHLPGALRGGLHAQPREPARHDQDDRAGDRRQGLGDGLGEAGAGRRRSPASASRSSARDRPAWPPPSSSPASATTSMSSSASRSPAGCCATAFPTSRWRSTTSTGA